jgi:hypothetical protein
MSANPMEWLSWAYGRFFTNHTLLSYFLVGSLAVVVSLLIALAVWTRAIDKYRADHPASPIPASEPKNETHGPQSPILPNNSGVVNITSEPRQSAPPPADKGSKKHAAETKTDKGP